MLRKGEKIRFLEQISESDHFSGDESDDTESTESSHSTSISDCCVGMIKSVIVTKGYVVHVSISSRLLFYCYFAGILL